MPMFGAFGTFTAVEGEQRQLTGVLLRVSKLLRDDPGCVQFIVGMSGESEVSVLELWRDEAAHDVSSGRDDVRRLLDGAQPLVAGVAGHARVGVVGGKGVPSAV